MAKLAIKGHKTSGWFVISLLKMMGGKDNIIPCEGTGDFCYFIDSDGIIKYQTKWNKDDAKFKQYTYGEFVEKFPFKVGDEVRLGVTDEVRITNMYWDSCSDQVIYEALSVNDGREYDNLHAKQLLPCKEQTSPDKAKAPSLKGEDYSEGRCSYKIPEGFEFDKVKNDEIILKPKKVLPKTYKECCKVLLLNSERATWGIGGLEYKRHLLVCFQRLLICRDAYWKIVGEQMGLCKHWEPDWAKADERKYCIVNTENKVTKWVQKTTNKILAFPTEEMCDVFYENFKELIEECKELL